MISALVPTVEPWAKKAMSLGAMLGLVQRRHDRRGRIGRDRGRLGDGHAPGLLVMDDQVGEGSSDVDGHAVTAHTAHPFATVRSQRGPRSGSRLTARSGTTSTPASASR